MQGRWAVAITQPNRESKAIFYATQQGFECYLPKIKTRTRIEPLFPRYVFVACDGAWRALLSTFGVTGIVGNKECPSTLPDCVINEIKLRCDSNNIYIPPPIERLRRGTRVRVKCGTLAGMLGTVHRLRKRERVEVLIKVLGAKNAVRANVYEGDLVAI